MRLSVDGNFGVFRRYLDDLPVGANEVHRTGLRIGRSIEGTDEADDAVAVPIDSRSQQSRVQARIVPFFLRLSHDSLVVAC